jgi:hypothetical protein
MFDFNSNDLLFKYFDQSGFEGTINTQTLRAGFRGHLNDNKEGIFFLKKFEILTREALSKNKLSNIEEKVSTIVKTAYGMLENFYVTSFAAHSIMSSNPLIHSIRDNGLSRMFKNYGNFLIVFDGPSLISMLRDKERVYDYKSIYTARLIYADEYLQKLYVDYPDYPAEKILNNNLSILSQWIESREYNTLPKQVLEALSYIAFVYKDNMYCIEDEFRIITLPKLLHQCRSPKLFKKIEGPANKRYITLFDYPQGTKLPIKNVIIGPYGDKKVTVSKCKKIIR